MPECRYCGKWFRSNKGLKTHITKSHTSRTGIGGRMINPMTIDPLGKMERRQKRRRR
jgi:uncharacterized C2H2 Zn-finger protein